MKLKLLKNYQYDTKILKEGINMEEDTRALGYIIARLIEFICIAVLLIIVIAAILGFISLGSRAF